MQDRRVIYDSEEEDEGLSPLNSPGKDNASHLVMTAEGDKEGQTLSDRIDDSRSTDPDEFRRIYEGQQKGITDSVPDSMRDTQAQNGFSDRLKSWDSKAKNNSSSITDPTLKSANKRAMGKIDTKEFGTLTQVTTPSAPSTKPKDVYDFSLSDEERAPASPVNIYKASLSKSGRTASKRKRDQSAHPDTASATANPPQLSTYDQFAADQEDESPMPTGKRRRSIQDQRMRQVPDDVDLLVIPTSINMSGPPNEMILNTDGSDRADPDTRVAQRDSHDCGRPPASFFIDPPHILTLSQKNEYLRISDHSEFDGEDIQQQASLPVPNVAQAEAQRSTSTSVSTIAYTTPSRFASSVEPLPILGTSDGRSSNAASSSGRRTQVNVTHPLSSPDELNAPLLASNDRDKRHMSIVNEEEELVQHGSWESDENDYSREAYVPKSSRRRSGAGQELDTSTHLEVDTGTARKKRRKRNETIETAHKTSWSSDEIGFSREPCAPKPKKKRFGAMVNGDDKNQHAEDSMPDTCPPGDASSKDTADIAPATNSLNRQGPDQATEAMAGVDPEVWAALPDDIRQELMSLQQPARTSQASRTRRSGRASEAAGSLAIVQEEQPQPKKRGRKKKGQAIEEKPLASDEPAATVDEPEARPSPAPTATAKRKRGRPRKSEAAPPLPYLETEEPDTATEAPELLYVADVETNSTHAGPDESLKGNPSPKAPAKRGRKKKVVEAPPVLSVEPAENTGRDEDCDDPDGSAGKRIVEPPHPRVDPPTGSVEVDERQALRDISSTASNTLLKSEPAFEQAAGDTSTEEAQQQQEVTPEPKAKDVPKSATTPGQQGKVPLRVGLSKKSRIAPLLKIIRK